MAIIAGTSGVIAQVPTWHFTGLGGGPWRALTCAPGGYIFASGASDNSISYSTDNGNTWLTSTLQGAGTILKLSAGTTGAVYAGTGGGVFKAYVQDVSWKNIGLASEKVLSVCSYSADLVLAGTEGHGIFRTTDSGATWLPVSSDTLAVYDIRRGNGDTVYAACVQDGVYRSTDKGATWKNTSAFNSAVCNLAIDSHGWVYGTIRLYMDAALGEFRSTDGGATWVDTWAWTGYSTSVGLEVNSRDDVYFATSAMGTFCFTQNSWRSANDGLPNADFYWLESIAINDKDELFAGTYASGVYHSTATVTGVGAKPLIADGFRLFQNYPNPFNPFTIIKYTVGAASGSQHASARPDDRPVGRGLAGGQVATVRLAVYDLLGRQVATLVDEAKAPGSYEVTFDASGLPSGVYFYRLQSGAIQETKQLILMK